MSPTYIIQSLNIDPKNGDLLIYICSQELSYIVIENASYTLLATYHFKEGAKVETVATRVSKIINDEPLFREAFKKVNIVYGYVASILVPHEYLNESANRPMLELVYGDATESIIHMDFMYRHNLHNVYAVPKAMEQALTRFFPYATHTHLYSLLPGIVTEAGNHLYCIFHTGHVTAMLLKDRRIQLIQNYSYAKPVDVAYHLLNICKSFDVEVGEGNTVHLAGMIDESSTLYNELFKYFPDLRFESLDPQYQYPVETRKYPGHFFSHLFQISRCV